MLLKRLFILGAVMVSTTAALAAKKEPLGSAENPVKFFFVPSTDTKLIMQGAKNMKKYLEANTPYKFETAVPASYIAVVESFGSKRADMAVINTFGYIMAHEKYGVQGLVRFERFGEKTYKAQIVVRSDSSVKKIEDLNGKKFAFVDPASASGYLLPAQLLAEKHVKPKETVFAKKHDNVITMVYQGQVDGGATFYTPPADGKIQDARRLVKTQFPDVEEKVKILELTKDIPNDPLMFAKDMPDDMKNKIIDAVLAYVKTEEGKKDWFGMYGVTGFERSKDSDWDGVRELLKNLGKKAADLVK